MRSVLYILIISMASIQCATEKKGRVHPFPNIILILTDDQGWGDAGFHGNKTIDTPNLDKLAQESVEFNRFYVSPVCAPTRASLLTGRYHLATGVSWVTHRKEVMRESEITIAELLKTLGYRTGLFGKWHNGKQYPHDPSGQGFDDFLGFTEGHLNNYFDARLTRNHKACTTKGYLPDVLTDSAISFIQKDGPFFCYLAYNTPHSPFQVPDHYFDEYKKKGLDDRTAAIYGMITNLDDNMGRLLEKLRASGKENETILIFLSDNGPNGHRYNGGFKGIKSHVDEGGVRVPFLIRYPDKQWKAGSKISDMAAHIDLLPTLTELVGLDIPDSLTIHGKSLVSNIEKAENDTSRLFFTHQVRRVFDTLPGAVRSHRYLLTLQPEDARLYDLLKDPCQKADLSDSLHSITSELEQEYYKWFENMMEDGIEPEYIEMGHPEIPLIEFPAQEATKYDHLAFKGLEGWANDYLVEWKDDSQVSWSLKSIAPLAYEVVLQAAFQVKTNSEVSIRIGDQKLERSVSGSQVKKRVESPDRVKRGEVYEYSWPEIALGKITVPKGIHQMDLTASGMESLEVKSIILKLIEHDK